MSCMNGEIMNGEIVSARANRWVIAAAIAVLILGAILSRLIEPGVHVEKVTLAGDTPALKFISTGGGPHPVALLAHGYASSKEALFRYGEALAAAGFICYSVDQPGHGASPRKYVFMDTVRMLEAVAREVGPVDVFAGWSMGGFTGGEAVREGALKSRLFIAIGSMPVGRARTLSSAASPSPTSRRGSKATCVRCM